MAEKQKWAGLLKRTRMIKYVGAIWLRRILLVIPSA